MNRIKISLVCLLCIVAFGIWGFMLFEHLTWLDAVYATIVIVSTVGFGDIVPVTKAGKIFTTILIILGAGTAACTLSLIFGLIVEGKIKEHFGRRTMLQEIADLNNHVIVCGAGRVGREVISGLEKFGNKIVVIEADQAKAELLLEEKIMTVCGDAKLDRVLQEAGVKKASFLIAALSNDADNVYVTLSARNQNSNIVVISRAEDEEAEVKMRQAGAATVVSPSISGGRQILAAIRHPVAYDFLDNMFYNKKMHYDMAEISIGQGSTLIGKTPSEVWKEYFFNLLIVSIKRDNDFLAASYDKEIMRCGDLLIVVGQLACIQSLTHLASTTLPEVALKLAGDSSVTG